RLCSRTGAQSERLLCRAADSAHPRQSVRESCGSENRANAGRLKEGRANTWCRQRDARCSTKSAVDLVHLVLAARLEEVFAILQQGGKLLRPGDIAVLEQATHITGVIVIKRQQLQRQVR